MSKEIFLQRFGSSGGEVPLHSDVIRDFEQIARGILRGAGEEEDVTVMPDGNSINIELPGGTATVNPTCAEFPIQELDSLTLRTIFELAKAGDMVIITEGGNNHAILTNPSQRSALPTGWIGENEAVPVCFSPEQLEHLLQDWHRKHTDFAKRAFADVQNGGEATWIPGSRVDGTASFVYIETKPSEAAVKQQKKLYKHYRDIYNEGSPNRPEKGLMMAEFWRLETPEGNTFYAYRFGGDNEKWLAMIKDFASTEGRRVGHIENFNTFVQDDGRQFPLSACMATKVKE